MTVRRIWTSGLLNNNFFIGWQGDPPKKEAYQCPSPSIDIEPRVRFAR
jgi:hypothetical protein